MRIRSLGRGQKRDSIKLNFAKGLWRIIFLMLPVAFPRATKTTWCDCGGRSPEANEVRYVGLMDKCREENDLWNTMPVWMCR